MSDHAPESPNEDLVEGPSTDVGVPAILVDSAWHPVFSDPVLSRPPAPGHPGNVPAGGDLRLDIGWDRFEQLLVFVAHGVLGLNQVRFRRYGVGGQAQHGIDIAGRHANGLYSVVQCKEYDTFRPADLRAAVEKFTEGRRPFDAHHLIVAVSTVARTTQLEDELAVLQDEHRDLDIEVWGAEQINDVLRERADIVSRFWTRETAETFCTGAPLPGVAAAPPNWIRVADQVLLTPLGVDGLDERLANADRLRASDPTGAAGMYQELANQLAAEGFTGHAHVLRHKQLDSLADAGELVATAALTAQLAATALHGADVYQARLLEHRLDALVRNHVQTTVAYPAETVRANAPGNGTSDRAVVTLHAELIRAAVSAVQHPLGERGPLISALRNAPPGRTVPYQPLLVLLVAELTAADIVHTPSDLAIAGEDGSAREATSPPGQLAELDDLIVSALVQTVNEPSTVVDNDVKVRLRLIRACYDTDERTNLLTLARQLRIPRPYAALALAAQARRDALTGSVDECLEHWRQAVGHVIHDGRTDDAGGWLYAIGAVNARYRWTSRIDEERLLAEALPKTTGGPLIHRTHDPETGALRAALGARPNEAIRDTRRWLADSIVTGDWVDEQTAAELLGDLYADNAEPDRAALCYQWSDNREKLVNLAAVVGDRLLPRTQIGIGPWWQQAAGLAGLAAQHDLLDDDTAGELLKQLLDLARRGRSGELIDSPTHSLTLQAMKTLCMLAGRGTAADAQAVLDLFADDVARDANQYKHHDEQHVQACLEIAVHHAELTWAALVRVFDLAEFGTVYALNALTRPLILDMVREPAPKPNDPSTEASAPRPAPVLSQEQRELLRTRLTTMAAAALYDAGLAVAALGGSDETVTARAMQARDRLLNRPEPDGHTFSFGTAMVQDSYLVSFLDLDDQQACLDKMLTVAADRREAAANRKDALIAANNLVLGQSDDVKADVHARSRAFVTGDQDGSALDSEITNPHPLSALRVESGSASLSAEGLRLAQSSAVTDGERVWVRDQAALLLGSSDEGLVHAGAVTLSRLDGELIGQLDATLLAGHHLPVVRQLATIVASAAPAKYALPLRALATDPDSTVRTLLAHRLHKMRTQTISTGAGSEDAKRINAASHEDNAIVIELLETLASDVRHTVRRAADGLRNG